MTQITYDEKTERQSWLHLTAIQLSGTLCIPVLMIGQTIALSSGILPTLAAIIIGNIFLFFISLLLTQHAITTRSNTTQVVEFLLGVKASKLFGVTMLISMIGWFSLQLALASTLISSTLNQALPSMGNAFLTSSATCILGLMTLAICIFGIEGIAKAAQWFFLPLAATLGLLFFYNWSDIASIKTLLIHSQWQFLPLGIATVIAGSLALVVDLPTYYHHANTLKDGTISCVLLFLVGTPLIQLLGAALISNQSTSLLETTAATGGTLWKLWIVIFLTISCIAINAANLFSATVILNTLVPFFSRRKHTALLLLSSIGTLGAFFDITNHFGDFLEAINIMVASMAALLVMQLLQKSKLRALNIFLAIGAFSSAVGFIEFVIKASLTGSILIDTFFLSLLLSYAATLLFKHFNH